MHAGAVQLLCTAASLGTRCRSPGRTTSTASTEGLMQVMLHGAYIAELVQAAVIRCNFFHCTASTQISC